MQGGGYTQREAGVTVPVSKDCGELAGPCDQGDPSCHSRVWRASREDLAPALWVLLLESLMLVMQ